MNFQLSVNLILYCHEKERERESRLTVHAVSLFFPVLCSLLAYRKLQKVSPLPEAMHSTLTELRVYRHALFPDRSCIVNARLSIYSGHKGPRWLWKSLECTRANKQALTRRVFLLCRSCNARARSRVYQISFLVRVLSIVLWNVENLEYAKCVYCVNYVMDVRTLYGTFWL